MKLGSIIGERMKPKIKEAYSAGYSAGISKTNCICKNWSPVEDYTVIRKELLIHLLKASSRLAKEKA